MGKMGTCCAEFDIWEANKVSSAYTAHPCNVDEQTRCEDADSCGDNDRYGGHCDKDGCDLNPYRVGVHDFYGEGLKINTEEPLTVVTQFITADGTDTGDLVEVRRKFVQNGVVFEHPMSNLGQDQEFNSLSDEMCAKVKGVFGDTNDFANKGGMKKMGQSLDKGMVLVLSLWDDHDVDMLWLDSTYPTDKLTAGGPRGTCSTSSGKPNDVESKDPNSYVKFSNIKLGELDSTYGSSKKEIFLA